MQSSRNGHSPDEWYRLEKQGQQMWLTRPGAIDFLVELSGATGRQASHLHGLISSQSPEKLSIMLGSITDADRVERY